MDLGQRDRPNESTDILLCRQAIVSPPQIQLFDDIG